MTTTNNDICNISEVGYSLSPVGLKVKYCQDTLYFSKGIFRATRSIHQQAVDCWFTQEMFAAKLGVTFPTINLWENEEAKPTFLALEKFLIF